MNRNLLLACCLLAACEHAWPYDSSGPGRLGPRGQALPRRLTYSSGDDRHPSVAGDVIVYSRLDPDEQGNERCVAVLPVEGGTILRETCPAPPRTLADTFVDTLDRARPLPGWPPRRLHVAAGVAGQRAGVRRDPRGRSPCRPAG